MVQITVSDEFARQLAAPSQPFVLVDSRGRELGRVTALKLPQASGGSRDESAEDDWAEAERQRAVYRQEGGTFYTTNEVLEHLNSLEKE